MFLDHESLMSAVSDRPASELEALGFQRRSWACGDTLWLAGNAGTALAIVAKGQVTVESANEGKTIALAGAGLGLEAAFFRGTRYTDTVVAGADCEVWTLSQDELPILRAINPRVYASLLRAALQAVGARFRTASATIGTLALPRLLVVEPPAGGAQRDGDGDTPIVPVDAVLASLPVLGEALESARGEIARVMRARRLSPGERLFSRGGACTELTLTTAGALRVYWEMPTGPCYQLTVLEPGTVLGIDPFLHGTMRPLTAVAIDEVHTFSLDAAAITQLSDAAQLILGECLLHTLRKQTMLIQSALSQYMAKEGFADLESLLQSVVGSASWRSGAAGIDISLAGLPPAAPIEAESSEKEALFDVIRRSILGADTALITPFGLRRVIYADYTASGRNLRFIEEFLQREVMPFYANTHTEASGSGRQTQSFREEARRLVAKSVGADEDYAVIFVGSGATGAINKLVDILNLRLPPDMPSGYGVKGASAEDGRPVIFHGPYEHHSNILPWRHSVGDVVVIPLDEQGGIDMAVLEQELIRYQNRPLRIGSFSAASNVTGILTDVKAVAQLLHRYGALSFWDYAAAGPYVPIEMKPSGAPDGAYKDAVFISPHKFIGGPGTPGVLVVRRELVDRSVPTQPGGGTVELVTVDSTIYSGEVTHREEAGTPAIQESIRCGLVFQLKDQVGAGTIHHKETALVRQALAAFRCNPNISVLGSPDADRLSIVSFMIRHGARYLHYNYVIALLNDLFGIQARGGCSCAGPYGGTLLGVGPEAGACIVSLVEGGMSSVKPGWARVNFNYFISDVEFRYIVTAIQMIAAGGYAIMPAYEFNPRSGLWTHRERPQVETMKLSALRLEGGGAKWSSVRHELPESALAAHLAEAERIIEAAKRGVPADVAAPELDTDYERARWFPLPHEIAMYLRRRNGGTRPS